MAGVSRSRGLQWPRVDLESKRIDITAQLQRIGGKLILTTPKTRKSIRSVRLCEAAVKALAAQKMRQAYESRDRHPD